MNDFEKIEHLRSCEFKNKEQYYCDLQCIENSITGRIDALIANKFIYEAKCLIINAINLYEMGYFDCAYYSLREAIEVSTIMVYLVDIPDKEREEKLNSWENLEWFPMREQMIKFLKNNGYVFVDFKEKMNNFFEDSKQYIEDINKYVHKQGWDKLYFTKEFFDYEKKLDSNYYLSVFEKYLKFTISYVAIIRLSIDPLPILLMDEDIYFKAGDLLTEPYTQDFLDRYIDKKYIEDYKNTELYKGYFSYFNSLEKQSLVISNIIKENYVDISKYDEILKQFHLLSSQEQIIVKIFKISDKISDIYLNGMPISYSSNTKSNRKEFNYNSEEFEGFKNKINSKYDNVYMSVFTIKDDDYYLEHNEVLNSSEIKNIEKI